MNLDSLLHLLYGGNLSLPDDWHIHDFVNELYLENLDNLRTFWMVGTSLCITTGTSTTLSMNCTCGTLQPFSASSGWWEPVAAPHSERRPPYQEIAPAELPRFSVPHHDRDVRHSTKELYLWRLRRFLHGLDGGTLALPHNWHINDLVNVLHLWNLDSLLHFLNHGDLSLQHHKQIHNLVDELHLRYLDSLLYLLDGWNLLLHDSGYTDHFINVLYLRNFDVHCHLIDLLLNDWLLSLHSPFEDLSSTSTVFREHLESLNELLHNLRNQNLFDDVLLHSLCGTTSIVSTMCSN